MKESVEFDSLYMITSLGWGGGGNLRVILVSYTRSSKK